MIPMIDRKRIYAKYNGIGCTPKSVPELVKEYHYSDTTIRNIGNDHRNVPYESELPELNRKHNFFRLGREKNSNGEKIYHIFRKPYANLDENSKLYYKNYTPSKR